MPTSSTVGVAPTAHGEEPHACPQLGVVPTVRLSFTRAGRKLNAKCRGASNKLRRNASCSRGQPVGAFSFTGHVGVNTVSFQGRVSASKKLAAASYTLTVRATNATGRQSRARSLSFKIVK